MFMSKLKYHIEDDTNSNDTLANLKTCSVNVPW